MIVHPQCEKKRRRKVAKSTKETGQIQGQGRSEDTDQEAPRTKRRKKLKTGRDLTVAQWCEERTDTAAAVLTVHHLLLITAPPSHHADKVPSVAKMTIKLLATDPVVACLLLALVTADLPHHIRMGTRVAVIMVTTVKGMAPL